MLQIEECTAQGIAIKLFSTGINLEPDCTDLINNRHFCNMSILLLHLQFKVILTGTFII